MKTAPDKPALYAITLSFCLTSILVIVFTVRYSAAIPYWDQWDYLKPVFEHRGLWESFILQHGPHRCGLGLVLTALLYRSWGWDARVESFAVVLLLIISALAAVSLKRKLTGRLSPLDAVIPFIFINPGAYETLIGTPQLANGPVPLFVLLLTAHALMIQGRYRLHLLLVLLGTVMMYTGFGIFSAMALAGVLMIQGLQEAASGNRDTAVIKLVSVLLLLLVMGSFFIDYHPNRAQECPYGYTLNPLILSRFVLLLFMRWNGFYADGIPWPSYLGGAFALLMLCFAACKTAVLVQTRSTARHGHAILFLLASGLLFAVGSALGRTCADVVGFAVNSRYMLYTAPAVLAVYILIVQTNKEELRRAGLALFVVLLCAGWVRNQRRDLPDILRLYALKKGWSGCFAAERDFSTCQSKIQKPIHPEPKAAKVAERLPLFLP